MLIRIGHNVDPMMVNTAMPTLLIKHRALAIPLKTSREWTTRTCLTVVTFTNRKMVVP